MRQHSGNGRGDSCTGTTVLSQSVSQGMNQKQVYTDEYNENIYREYEVERRALTYQIEQLIYPRERKKKRRKKKRGERERKAVYPVAHILRKLGSVTHNGEN